MGALVPGRYTRSPESSSPATGPQLTQICRNPPDCVGKADNTRAAALDCCPARVQDITAVPPYGAVKCLSIAQPFAHLVVTGRKKVELRTWNTSFRGRFLVHAPLKARAADMRRLGVAPQPLGAVVGSAEITGVKRYETASALRRDRGLHLSDRKPDGAVYGFVLRRPEALRDPVPCRGMLGFFNVDGLGR